jgi:hypothetical protein
MQKGWNNTESTEVTEKSFETFELNPEPIAESPISPQRAQRKIGPP